MQLTKTLSKIYLYCRAIPKSLLFNFRYLPFSQAIKFPVVVSHRVKFLRLGGVVKIPKSANTGKIRIGFGQVQVADSSRSRMLWSLGESGKVTLGERVKIGTGCKLFIDGNLNIGSNTNLTGESTVVCEKEVRIGDGCLVSWQTIIMDTDFHPIIDTTQNIRLNHDLPISIGDKSWIGARVTMTKGSSIGNNCVVATSTHLHKTYDENDIILGGNPARIIGSMIGKAFTD
ncbi:acyltransferase [Vibrio penaeicida]|uniref:acyltransferase n=1 Tax=Vibrio penaeicida TaxID=104609 RepID=UPI002732497C|nr:acyltransferase [Vibrio penaeicida]MDP2573100.1 acyltransferase [Vibrio penaeicida]